MESAELVAQGKVIEAINKMKVDVEELIRIYTGNTIIMIG